MKPDWKALVEQKRQELPEVRREMEEERKKHRRKMDKLINKLEKQLFRKVKKQTAGTQELYDLLEPCFGQASVFKAMSPFCDYCWRENGEWRNEDTFSILAEVEQRMISGGVDVKRSNKKSALFLLTIP